MVVDWARCSSANEYRFWTMFSMTQKLFNSSDQPTSQVLLLPKQYPDEAMMSSFQTPANSSFTYPHIMQHYIYSPKIEGSIVKQTPK